MAATLMFLVVGATSPHPAPVLGVAGSGHRGSRHSHDHRLMLRFF